PALLPRAGEDRRIRRPLDVPQRARSELRWWRGCVARIRRRARRQRLGSSTQVPDPSRPAHARAIRELPARWYDARQTGGLGPHVFLFRARLGRASAVEAGGGADAGP